ncbi:unnamed protein product [Soboliphyme baturini]|uniref:Uncharacterized protein n=1 Tax=Soboliphyme baturini TaxID=241478 RepID=A0A183J1W0_9BILA|nr:unnamed protein product [Soboliphyme baturini]
MNNEGSERRRSATSVASKAPICSEKLGCRRAWPLGGDSGVVSGGDGLLRCPHKAGRATPSVGRVLFVGVQLLYPTLYRQ